MALKGAELLAKVREMSDATKTDLVTACGYVTTRRSGRRQVNFTTFYEALLQAKGLSIGEAVGKGGRKLSYLAKVQGNGNLLIGRAYTEKLDLKPGDEFIIKLGRRQIRLVPVGAEDDMGTEEQET
ncbi:MAG: AbrB family transcriptional regulator [Aphanocapsa feldmannii 277cV]|uniref:AbrB family transcriptional regulator n=2 Tax=Aphanocapsa feldmannii TaxID=192050 RepID=A0A524RLB5_9CHRO|nr:MAG: AbrB family transcriptional regulator [Aphanocapsa feldmannii 288cV]TGG90861.1 MAG: AbrB family transcriptional regulator [Aphanocapsa feldmannii 277cV]TGH27073.1 MAG: AbrB family transcriptional regulator [Aphanocapsa feldmannii 277cI]